jgi:hypothetical protein
MLLFSIRTNAEMNGSDVASIAAKGLPWLLSATEECTP